MVICQGHLPCVHLRTVLHLPGHWQSSATDLPACPQAGLALVQAGCNHSLHAQGNLLPPFCCNVFERTCNSDCSDTTMG